jgi:hypothetical protein
VRKLSRPGLRTPHGLEVSPDRQKREAKKRRRQEKKWSEKSGPVTVYVDPPVVKQKQSSSEQ